MIKEGALGEATFELCLEYIEFWKMKMEQAMFQAERPAWRDVQVEKGHCFKKKKKKKVNSAAVVLIERNNGRTLSRLDDGSPWVPDDWAWIYKAAMEGRGETWLIHYWSLYCEPAMCHVQCGGPWDTKMTPASRACIWWEILICKHINKPRWRWYLKQSLQGHVLSKILLLEVIDIELQLA